MKCTESQIREALNESASMFNFRGKSLKALNEYMATYPSHAAQANWESLIDMTRTMSDQICAIASNHRVSMK